MQAFRYRVPSAQAAAAAQSRRSWAHCRKLGDARTAAVQEMERPPRKVTFFPVEDDGQLVGLVTLHGLVSAGL